MDKEEWVSGLNQAVANCPKLERASKSSNLFSSATIDIDKIKYVTLHLFYITLNWYLG